MTRADPVAAVGRAFATLRRRPHAILAAWAPAALAVLAGDLAIARLAPGFAVGGDLARALPILALVTVVRVASWGLVAAAALRVRPPGPLRLLAMGALLFLAFLLSPLLLFAPIYWLLFAPAALADGRSFGGAFAASRSFARERRTYGFTALMVLVWVVVAVASTYGVAPLLDRVMPLPLADALATWVLGALVPLLPASYWALAREAAPEEAPPTGVPERATTACPRCGTLVERAATRVRCPACGFEGNVL